MLTLSQLFNNSHSLSSNSPPNLPKGLLKSTFEAISKGCNVITPVFCAFANGLTATMDKMSTIGKGGQLPWAKAGIGNEAYNKIIARVRKFGRIFRQKQSLSYRLEYS